MVIYSFTCTCDKSRSVGSNYRVETNGRTSGHDRFDYLLRWHSRWIEKIAVVPILARTTYPNTGYLIKLRIVANGSFMNWRWFCLHWPIRQERLSERLFKRHLINGLNYSLIHQAAKLVAALLRVAAVTAGLAESNGSLPPGLWLTSPAGWVPSTRISSGTLRLAIEYGLPTFLTADRRGAYF